MLTKYAPIRKYFGVATTTGDAPEPLPLPARVRVGPKEVGRSGAGFFTDQGTFALCRPADKSLRDAVSAVQARDPV